LRAIVTAALGATLLASPVLAAEKDGWDVLHAPAKIFAIQDLEGKALRSTELAGKVVVIDFWATWCAPCIKELPALSGLHDRLKDRSDVTLLSFNVTDEAKTLVAFVRDKKVGFPVYRADALVGPYELTTFPTKLVIDMRAAGRGNPGLVRYRREGETPVASIEARVAEILAEKP
jgi:thiol-disulfide isomerase/thioredoxin